MVSLGSEHGIVGGITTGLLRPDIPLLVESRQETNDSINIKDLNRQTHTCTLVANKEANVEEIGKYTHVYNIIKYNNKAYMAPLTI